jgi:hypothetical protein
MSEQTPSNAEGEQLPPKDPSPQVTEAKAQVDPDAPAADAGRTTQEGGGKATSTQAASASSEKDRTIWFWVLGIVAALSIELYVYGHNGFVQVCVGVEGVTDFSQRGTLRSAANAKTAPFCASRLNLGMYSDTDERAQEALNEACSRATILNRKELTPCLRRENKWARQVYKEQVPPWDKRLYRRLLWLD